jgi:hypothetical protein
MAKDWVEERRNCFAGLNVTSSTTMVTTPKNIPC